MSKVAITASVAAKSKQRAKATKQDARASARAYIGGSAKKLSLLERRDEPSGPPVSRKRAPSKGSEDRAVAADVPRAGPSSSGTGGIQLMASDVLFSTQPHGSALSLCVGGGSLSVGTSDGVAVQWDIHSAEITATLDGHESGVHSVCCQEKTLFTACAEAVRCWSQHEGTMVEQERFVDSHPITTMAIQRARGRKRLLTGLCTGKIVQREDGVIVGGLDGHVGPVHVLAVNGARCFSSASDGAVKEWDLLNSVIVRTYWSYGKSSAMCVSGGFLYTGSITGRAKRYLTTTADCDVSTQAHDAEITVCHSFVADQPYILTATADGILAVWDLKLGTPLQVLQVFETKAIRALSVSDGMIYAASEDGDVKVYKCVEKEAKDWLVVPQGQVSHEQMAYEDYSRNQRKEDDSGSDPEKDDSDCLVM